VSDIKTVEEIAMKKPKTMADLLAVANVCIEASEARARLLESCGKGASRKKQDDWEVNTTNRGGSRDHGYRGNHRQESLDQKENGPFHCPVDAEKWCKIWKRAKLFWITRRCHHQQHQWPKNPIEANIAEPILTTRIRWGKSM
jgi:hypothetical protein